ncbi:hypothetical protein LTR37_007582 [Vermiconidia calcicola]|uniref:Uncharacterized protein n=1 Tax=Vermiconidia calcicola TaxID=1690605 RepID=A0ACC3ND68_9PEZI|nr:hypothetical protein LTR37_007582 [Vermiconidia calcicola]
MDNDIEKQAQDGKAEVIRPAGQPDSSLVEFDGPDDPGNPKNWSVRRRIAISMSMALMTFVVTFSSSIFAVATGPIAEEFGIDITTATLGVALFLLGFVLGPVLFGPASEVYGRRAPLFVGYIVFAIFQIPVAVGQNVATIMLGRFLSGLFASAPLAVVGGAFADMWDPVERTYAICGFATGTVGGREAQSRFVS